MPQRPGKRRLTIRYSFIGRRKTAKRRPMKFALLYTFEVVLYPSGAAVPADMWRHERRFPLGYRVDRCRVIRGIHIFNEARLRLN